VTVSPGTHTVCVFAIDADQLGHNALLDCRLITTT
jgi:hypothetical protein